MANTRHLTNFRFASGGVAAGATITYFEDSTLADEADLFDEAGDPIANPQTVDAEGFCDVWIVDTVAEPYYKADGDTVAHPVADAGFVPDPVTTPTPTTALFTLGDARAYVWEGMTPLSDATAFPDQTIIDKEASIRQRFELLCGVKFVATSITETFDATGTQTIRVSRRNPFKEDVPRPITVTAASIDGVALTVAQLADLVCYPDGRVVRKTGYWLGSSPNLQNVSITYTVGYASVPGPIRDAALKIACLELVSSDVPEEAVSMSDGTNSYTLANLSLHWVRAPGVWATLRDYDENLKAV